MKKGAIAIAIVVVLIAVAFFVFGGDKSSQEQLVLEKTYNLSKEYASLRYQTDKLLVNAKDYSDYQTWNNEMSTVIADWENLATASVELEKLGGDLEQEKVASSLIPAALAYDKQEISNVYDKAPAGQKIKTLAKFLGVDAKRAFEILKQDQAQVEADAWNEAGNTFQTLETSATLIKDGCKATAFVGGIIVSGGTAAIAAGSTLAQATVVITGTDLVLEVSDDAAKISLGNNNKISSIISDGRKVTEPLATILAITNIPENLGTSFEKFSAVMTALDQFNSAAQDGKIVGVELPAYQKDKKQPAAEVVVLSPAEITDWLASQGISNDSDTLAEIEEILTASTIKKDDSSQGNENLGDKEETKNEEATSEEAVATTEKNINENDNWITENSASANGPMVGTWSGSLTYIPGYDKDEVSLPLSISLNSDGTVRSDNENFNVMSWAQSGNSIKLMKAEGYFEFVLNGNNLTFVKMAGPDSEGEWSEILAGSDFFSGKFWQINLQKK